MLMYPELILAAFMNSLAKLLAKVSQGQGDYCLIQIFYTHSLIQHQVVAEKLLEGCLGVLDFVH